MPATSTGRPGAPPARGLVIAVDGPSGSGKSSVSREVALRLGLRYLDTGAMYRALTWWALEGGIDLHDDSTREQVAELARKLPLDISLTPASQTVTVDGND